MECHDCPNRIACWKVIKDAMMIGCNVLADLSKFIQTLQCAREASEFSAKKEKEDEQEKVDI